jgi:hypothetical protein
MASIKKDRTIKEDLKELERVDGRAGADTIRLWESFREQAYMWRALALLQIPGTFVAVLAAIIMYTTADTIIEVPQMPQPGHYSVKQLPDSEFINVATEIVNHIASYQPKIARKQFVHIRDYLWEPALTAFEEEVMKKELPAIEETGRSQLFFPKKSFTRVQRAPGEDRVVVRLAGSRQKMIGAKILPVDTIVYYVKMTTIPRSAHNEFGIVAVDIRLKKTTFDELMYQDRQEERGSRKKIVKKR